MAQKPPLSGGCLCGGVRYELECSVCGSALWSRHPRSGAMSVRLGTFDGDPGIRPQWHQFVAYASAWEPVPDDGLPRYPEGKPAT